MSNVSTTTAAIYQAVLDSLNSSGECGVLPPAPPGKSAYEVAVANGFKGSEKQWLDSLTLKQEQEIARLEARILSNEKHIKDSNNAASKLVGTTSGRIPLVQDIYSVVGSPQLVKNRLDADVNTFEVGTKSSIQNGKNEPPVSYRAGGVQWMVDTFAVLNTESGNLEFQMAYGRGGNKAIAFRNKANNGYTEWVNTYTNANVKKDSKTNLLLESGDSIPNNSAASRLVGNENGQVATWKSGSIEGTGLGGIGNGGGPHRYKAGTAFGGGLSMGTEAEAHETPAQVGSLNAWHSLFSIVGNTGQRSTQAQVYFFNERMFYRSRNAANAEIESEWSRGSWAELYSDKNTTVGTNKEIIRSSPVLRVFKDSIEKIHEANDLDIEFIVNGVGDYTIKGTTGIRDGREDWTINIPKDNHDNQLIAFTMEEEEGGIVHLKTYKRIFSMETFTFGPDLDTPMHIPDDRWVDLHFNDLPEEELDESDLYPEEEPEVAEDDPVVEDKKK